MPKPNPKTTRRGEKIGILHGAISLELRSYDDLCFRFYRREYAGDLEFQSACAKFETARTKFVKKLASRVARVLSTEPRRRKAGGR